MENNKNFVVTHQVFGSGFVMNIEHGIIEINFGDNIKKFQFPKSFDSFLKTDDEELLQIVCEERQRLTVEPKTKPLIQRNMSNTSNTNAYSFSRTEERHYNGSISNTLVGARAQTIPVNSEAEMFEIIGYIASPGRLSSIEAEVPKDGRDKIFEKLFPGQTYRPIEMGNTPSGLPNKLSPQFRINFSNIWHCPDLLRKNIGKGNGSCVGRINKSAFVIDIVQNYGFRFGDRQDVAAIKAIAEKHGHVDDFERGYKR